MSTDCCEFMITLSLLVLGLVCSVTGRLEVLQMHQTSKIKLWIHVMDFTNDDKHKMELNPELIPTPFIDDRLSSSFVLSVSEKLV